MKLNLFLSPQFLPALCKVGYLVVKPTSDKIEISMQFCCHGHNSDWFEQEIWANAHKTRESSSSSQTVSLSPAIVATFTVLPLFDALMRKFPWT